MSKLKNVVVAFLGLLMFMVTPVFPQGNAGCKNGKFVGSYTHLDTFPDVWGDGTNVLHQFIRQLTLHSDGTATEETTGAPISCSPGEPPRHVLAAGHALATGSWS